MSPSTLPAPTPEHVIDDFDEARDLLARLYGHVNADLRPGATKRFAWRVRPIPLGSTTVILGDIVTGMTVRAEEGTRYVLGMPRRGYYDVRNRGREFIAVNGESGFMVSPGTGIHVVAPENIETFNLSIEPSALVSHLHALTGAPSDLSIRFEPYVDLRRGSGANIVKLAHVLREASERPDGPLASPCVLVHLREALYGAILAGLDSTASRLLQRPPPYADRRAVRRVEEYILAHLSEPVSIAALAELTGVGIRSLERSFKAVHGCSIRAFLKTHRLDLARRRLTTGAPGTTVTQILYASGFGHPGEFSLAYRKQFGEAPSETMRRASGVTSAMAAMSQEGSRAR